MITDAIPAIFVVTYVGMAIGRIPSLRTDRAGLALVAAVLMIVVTGAGLKRRADVGASLPFLAHARAGIPITILTLAVAALWPAGVVPL